MSAAEVAANDTVSSGGGRPDVYRAADGKRVPGVTTVLGKFKDPGGLIHWAWELGRDAKAESALDSFKSWVRSTKLTIVDTERPLVSELHRFGGTYDALGIIDGDLILLDWKSSNRVYTEHVAQLAAYRQLIREATRRQVTGARLLRVGKELGDFHDHSFPAAALDMGWERFLASKWLYETDAKLKKAVGT